MRRIKGKVENTSGKNFTHTSISAQKLNLKIVLVRCRNGRLRVTCTIYDTIEAEKIQLKISVLDSQRKTLFINKTLLTHSYLINNINDNNYT